MSEKLTTDYQRFITRVTDHVQQLQLRATVHVNAELMALYWQIGKDLAQGKGVWGKSTIEQLAHDLQHIFPGIAGFSRINLLRMRAFYQAYATMSQPTQKQYGFPPDICLQIPWGHNIVLFEKLAVIEQRIWYAAQTVQHGWSKSMLIMWIESNLYERRTGVASNFKIALPQPQSDLAQQILKDPYCFDFLTLSLDARERELEAGLLNNIHDFLMELGQGFAFIGKQYHLEVDNKDYYLDLLFYHMELRCYVVIELKAREFEIIDAAQIGLYLAAVDDTLRREHDQPTIGIILCQSKSKLTVEYALRIVNKPVGVASFQTKLVEALPKQLQGSLPSVARLKRELRPKVPMAKRRKRT